ncbi:LPXTG cell wall anchor domain-containing protein [Vagococcus fluvialis]|uniref:LPXTG cell wall anchor domain-containing protein n=1 Tax=Vagococcus fluvialis TaxID=2738 RepID=UPI001D09DB42|nr:LPXTG cell wall anchor domain-containing protein [Vagococcus fluvialis]UDM70918.1 LPXTG cell wall anchor domain-containing protein [Vagococcus fluvialis]UDM75774.1 LPXTG cell wall anchor domain-containing protein [Vagococcus fluvialis]UDM82605.1 LPXTG cell wall anchor domain-containing protein [Vagococcus fluvialis]
MKKAKLSTALLVILAGSFGAPLISAAEVVSEVGTHESAVVLEEKEEPELPVDEEVVEGEVEGTGEETPEEKPEENPGTGNEETPPVTPEEPTGGNEGEEGTRSETEGETDEEYTLEEAKEDAVSQVEYWKEVGFISEAEYNRLILGINNATTVDEVTNIIASVEFLLEAIKKDAKMQVQGWYDGAFIEKEEYNRLNTAIDAAETVEEIDQILANVKFNEKLITAKGDAYDELLAAYENGRLTDDELEALMMDISNATTIETVNEIMARFRAHIINPTLILNTANLSNTIAEAKTLVEANYTKDSWTFFAAALANSEELLAATEVRMITNITQVEIDSSTAALKNAMGQLVAVNGKVVDPTAPVLTSVTKTNTTNAANLPETGEKENRLMALYGMMMSGLAGLFLVKKRKAERESL